MWGALAAAVLLVVAVAVLLHLRGGKEASVEVFGPLVDLRPGAVPAGGTDSVSVSAARNETVGYQLRIAGPLRDVEVEAGSLTGPRGTTIPAAAVSVYREAYYDVKIPSDAEGGKGLWPDALIPLRDPFYGERRDAFPVDVKADGQLAIWVDVTAGAAQPAGLYHGMVRVSSGGATAAEVPVTVTIEPFGIPSTSSLKSAFFVEPAPICAAFGGCTKEERWADTALFAEAALDDRLTLVDSLEGDPPETGFQRHFLPLLDGTAPHVRLPGARLTSIGVWGPKCGDCLKAWRRVAERDGFAGRFFLYACDEPSTPAEWTRCAGIARRAERRWPGVRALVTAPYRPSASWVDVYAPIINELDPPGGFKLRPPDAAAAYARWLGAAPGRELWSYTSCASYSCTGGGGAEFTGWPGYAIDQPPFEASAMSWLAFLYGFTGELYYSTTASLATATTDQYVSGGNGDGNLFYAGTPDGGNGSIAVGGRRPIPIESIRLKRIRDGREEYEYLKLAEARGLGRQARAIAASLFGSVATAAHETDVPAARVEAARRALTELLVGSSG